MTVPFRPEIGAALGAVLTRFGILSFMTDVAEIAEGNGVTLSPKTLEAIAEDGLRAKVLPQ